MIAAAATIGAARMWLHSSELKALLLAIVVSPSRRVDNLCWLASFQRVWLSFVESKTHTPQGFAARMWTNAARLRRSLLEELERAHGAPKLVGFRRCESGRDDRDLHGLLLEKRHAEGLLDTRLSASVG